MAIYFTLLILSANWKDLFLTADSAKSANQCQGDLFIIVHLLQVSQSGCSTSDYFHGR